MRRFVYYPKSARNDRRGVALILTLAILALLSILLVSFVSMAAHDRGATQSYSKSMQADQTALGGLDVIVSQIQAEIADPALSTNSAVGSVAPLYIPLNNTNAMPQKMTPNMAGIATLIGYSGTNLFTAGAGVPNYSSGSSTLNNSFNGRVVSLARWNKPQLTTSTANFPTPQWILVTRNGPQAFSSYNSTMADSSALNGNFVAGRYAYTIYDTSGLIDANVAGYPGTAPTASIAGKGLLPWADLTQLSPAITQGDVNTLVSWRNASSSSSYATYVTTAATNSGFTRVANGDTTFLSRQELIKYAQTQNPDLTNALPYLTTFSRELNGPTWGPTTNATASGTYAYAASQYTPESFNPRIPNPRVVSAFKRANGVMAVPGEPLVKYRFPLDKLALLEKFMGTGTGNLSATETAEIQQYFGLDVATDSNGPSFRHWTYPTTSTTYKHGVLSGANGIMTLDDVAAQNREPDFFELLQAGILSGSLGVPGKSSPTGPPNPGRSDQQPVNGNGNPGFIDPDDSVTLQTLRIGANIIDQWDADSFPTTVTYTNQGSPISVEGIEDLPYPFAAYMNVYSSNTTNTGTSSVPSAMPPFNFYLYFGLWNPHQQPTSTVAANYPSNFRFFPFYNSSQPGESDSFVAGFINSGLRTTPTAASWFYNGTATIQNGGQGAHTPLYLGLLFPTGVSFNYTPTTPATDYREPAIASGTTPGVTWPWNTNACFVLPPLTNFPSMNELANEHGLGAKFPAITAGTSGPNSGWQSQVEFTTVMPVQYEDANNNWHTYGTFLGMDDPSGIYSHGNGYDSHTGTIAPNMSPSQPSLSAFMLVKSDPRTFRFGIGSGGTTPDVNLPVSTSGGTPNYPVTGSSPFGASGVSGTAPYRMDYWAANNSAVSVFNPHAGSSTMVNNPYYPDTDGVQRMADAGRSYLTSTPTSPLFAGANANRPVMLNRPFQSVGDLGYVFRDMPWKTLDLFSPNSADSGLLDLFTISDAPITGGRVNPNTPYSQVLAALLNGNTQSIASGTTVSSANAATIAQAITNTTSVYPFMTRADLVNSFMTNSAVTSTLAPNGIKTEQETVARAIAETSNTRTWNFMIDIIAQSGRYPTSAMGLDNFVVEGERRYWLHLAIDRYTGQVVDKQLEVVNE